MDMKKKIIYGFILILIISTSGYYLYQHAVDIGLAKPALILKVATNQTEWGATNINNVTFEQSSVIFFYKRADTIPEFPSLEVNARLNELNAAPSSFWASTPYKNDEKEGVYTLKILFRDGNEPKPGDVLILPINNGKIHGFLSMGVR